MSKKSHPGDGTRGKGKKGRTIGSEDSTLLKFARKVARGLQRDR